MFLSATSLNYQHAPKGWGAVLFLFATSLTTMMRLGVGSGWSGSVKHDSRPSDGGKEAQPCAPFHPLGNRSDQLQPPGRVSSSRSDHLQPPDGCPTTGGPTSNPDRRTGPRTEDLNTPPVRSALPAESNFKSAAAAFPRGRPFQRANQIRQVMPGQQGPCPRDFYGGKPRKSQTTQLVSPRPAVKIKGLGAPEPKVFNPVHKNLHKTYTKVS